jgi:uncharacterized protein YyaL (SSP411 family)
LPNTILSASSGRYGLPGFEDRFIDKNTMIYVCTGWECKLPVEMVEEAIKQTK